VIFFLFFWDRVSWTICLGWLQTSILLIPVSWVARITGVSHWRLAPSLFWFVYSLLSFLNLITSYVRGFI
jgi:hypothetical protein